MVNQEDRSKVGRIGAPSVLNATSRQWRRLQAGPACSGACRLPGPPSAQTLTRGRRRVLLKSTAHHHLGRCPGGHLPRRHGSVAPAAGCQCDARQELPTLPGAHVARTNAYNSLAGPAQHGLPLRYKCPWVDLCMCHCQHRHVSTLAAHARPPHEPGSARGGPPVSWQWLCFGAPTRARARCTPPMLQPLP